MNKLKSNLCDGDWLQLLETISSDYKYLMMNFKDPAYKDEMSGNNILTAYLEYSEAPDPSLIYKLVFLCNLNIH